MLSVYDPLCNGLREPRNVNGRICLTWRLGSDRIGAHQASYDVIVVSLESGSVLWDSGCVHSQEASCVYGGIEPAVGEVCSWFVTVTDDAGEETQSLPAAFWYGPVGATPTSEWDEQRLGFVWTSDEQLNDSLERDGSSSLYDPAWHSLLGVSIHRNRIRVAPTLVAGLSFAQGSLLLPQGLLVVRWEQEDGSAQLQVSLPPGTTGELVFGDERREVLSGRHCVIGYNGAHSHE